jgi:hypothetical protein
MTVTSNNACGSATATATYSVVVNEPVVITDQPDPQTVCATFPVGFSVTATGTGLSYQWLLNGNPVGTN